MSKATPTPHADQIERIRHACSTLEELHEETWLLYDSITADSRKARAALKRPKAKRTTPKR